MAGPGDERDASPAAAAPMRRQVWVLLALGAGFVLVYAVLYPPTYSIIDEQGYLSFALTLLDGTIFADVAGVNAMRVDLVGGHRVPEFPLGTSALLVPAVAVDWRSSFAVILLVHLVGTSLCALALRRAGLPIVYAALYLFHPVATLYSRTAMSDVPAAAVMMAGVAAWVGRPPRPFLAGLALGFAPHFRFAQAVAIGAFGAAVLIRDLAHARRTRSFDIRRSFFFALGLVPGVLSFAVLNTVLYGGPFDTPLVWPLSAAHLPTNLARYLVSQNLVYPLALFVAFIFPSRLRLECILVGGAMLLLYGSFQHLYQGFGIAQQVLIGDRFFLPLLPLVVIPYAGFLEWILARWPRQRTALLAVGIALLAAVSIGISIRHQARLDAQQRVQARLYEATTDDSVVMCSGVTSIEYFFDGIAPRTVILAEWTDAGGTAHNATLARMVDQRVPEVYLVTAERMDRGERDQPASDQALAIARKRYRLREVARIEEYPDRIRVLQAVSVLHGRSGL